MIALFRIFRRDKLLLALVLLASVACTAPLAQTPLLPFADLPNHVGIARALWGTMAGEPLMTHHFVVQYKPVPYWTIYLLLGAAVRVFGVIWGTRLVVGAVMLLMPLAVIRLLHALGRDPRLGLLAFLLAWNHNTYWGWVAFELAMTLSIFALAWVIEKKTARAAVMTWPLGMIIALTHAQAVIYLAAVGVLVPLFFKPRLKMFANIVLLGIGPASVVLPWIKERTPDPPPEHVAGIVTPIVTPTGEEPDFWDKIPLNFGWETQAQKVQNFLGYTIGDILREQDAQNVAVWTFFAFVSTLAILHQREPGRAQRVHGDAAPAFLLGPLALYALLPMSMDGAIKHWHTYPRYAVYVLVGLIAVSRGSLRGRAWLRALPAFALCLLLWNEVGGQMRAFGRTARPLLEIAHYIPKHRRVLSLRFDIGDPRFWIHFTKSQVSAYVSAMREGYEPYLFNYPSLPLLYRGENRLPRPGPQSPVTFRPSYQAASWDYVLVQGSTRDPIRTMPPDDRQWLEVMADAGDWRLYRVIPPDVVEALAKAKEAKSPPEDAPPTSPAETSNGRPNESANDAGVGATTGPIKDAGADACPCAR